MNRTKAVDIGDRLHHQFPKYSVKMMPPEATINYIIYLVSTEKFVKTDLARMIDFANSEGLGLRVGGDGNKFHTAEFYKQ